MSSHFVVPLARVLGWPATLIGGAAGSLARDNARRNPQRTASTAAALMIGLALVTLVATLAGSIIGTFNSAVDDLARGEFYAITAQNNFSPIPISAANAAAKTQGLESIANVRAGDGLVFGHARTITAVDPTIGTVINLDWKEGSQAVLSTLGSSGAFVDDGFAKNHGLRTGSQFFLLTPTGKTLPLTVAGIFKPPAGGSPFGPVTISSATFDANYTDPKNLFTFVTMKGGVTAANTKALETSLAKFPNAKVADGEQFKKNQVAGLKSVLNVLYVLLALSVLVSIFGIVNTLVLTVFERTRELGMLRAIGMTRRQVRQMIRHESVITSLIGAVIGLVLGLILAALLIARVKEINFFMPWSQLVLFLVLAILVGDRRGDLPRAAGGKAQPARGAAVRVVLERDLGEVEPVGPLQRGERNREILQREPGRVEGGDVACVAPALCLARQHAADLRHVRPATGRPPRPRQRIRRRGSPAPSRHRTHARAPAPRRRSPPCRGRPRPSARRAGPVAASRSGRRISRPGVTVTSRSAASASSRLTATRPPTRSATAPARAVSTSHTSGARPRAAKVRAAASPFTPAPTTAALVASARPRTSAASTAAAPVRAAVTAPASSTATSRPSSADETSTTPITVGRPRAGLPGNDVTHFSSACPPPSAGIARKSPAGYAPTYTFGGIVHSPRANATNASRTASTARSGGTAS